MTNESADVKRKKTRVIKKFFVQFFIPNANP